ncbi:hypothetical protein DFH28DRAFT_1093019 [Melampsora americana]|nr:hypothetical protein DFH28DRAFT_1093019 [Melampsora americana]
MNHPFRSPAAVSNYDRFGNSGIRHASMAFGMEDENIPTQTPPNLRNSSSQNSSYKLGGEPNYGQEDTPNSTQARMPVSSLLGNSADGNVDAGLASNLISDICEEFGLTSTDKSDIEKVINKPSGVAREIATLCYFRKQISNLEKLVIKRPIATTNIPIEPNVDQIDQLNLHDQSMQTFIRDRIKETLKTSCIQAYATNFTPNGHPILESLENLVVRQLIAARNKIPDKHLPEGYRDSDLTADTQVRKVIKEIAKVERCKYQNAVLVNIKDPPLGTKPARLPALLFDLTGNKIKNHTKTQNDIWNETSIADKSRLALLRLEGTIFLLQPKDSTAPRESPMKMKTDRSMWDAVDQRLTWIRTLSKDHQILFHQWILDYESKIFTGTLDFQQIKQQVKIQIINPNEFGKWIIEGCPSK